MTHADVVACYDEPDDTQAMCDMIMRAYPGWTVWRENRIWKGRHDSRSEDLSAWENENAGFLAEQIYAVSPQAES